MSAYVRQRQAQIVNGELADADDIAAELNAVEDAFSTTYMKSNILGEVGFDSGGDPDGGIIDSGNNSFGRWIRFANGTQITFSNVVKSSSGNVTREFPANFISPPRLLCQSVNSPTSSPSTFIAVASTPGTSSYTVNLYNFITGAQVNGSIDVVAIGRWA
jgi:hypothetical protein